MLVADVNVIMRAFLVLRPDLIAAVGNRIYCPRLPEGTTLPALGFFVRGGSSIHDCPLRPQVSFQFDCWAATPQGAREVYRALYSSLQDTWMASVVVGANTYTIQHAMEEVQGQDIQETEIIGYSKVLTFFRVFIEA